MPLIVSNNPAGRLHAIIQRARELTDRERSQAAIESISSVLGVDLARNRAIAVRMFVDVLELPSLVEAAIRRQSDIKHSIYLAWVPDVRNVFKSNNFDEALTRYLGPFNPSAMSLLAVCDDILSRKHEEPLIEQSLAEKILKEARDLIVEVTKSDIPSSFREYILRHLHLVERAILESQCFGVSALERGLEASVGAAVMRRDISAEVAKTPMGQKMVAILGAFVLVCNAINGPLQIASSVQHLYLPEAASAAAAQRAQATESPSDRDGTNHRNADQTP